MRLVRHLAAERDGEPEGGPGGGAEPRGEQLCRSRGLSERRQRCLLAALGLDRGVEGRVGRRGVLEDAVLVDGVRAGPQPVALPQQRPGLDEPQRQALGLEPQVAGPVRLVLGEDPADAALQEVDARGTVEPFEGDLLDAGVGGRRGHLGRGGQQEGALGGRVEQLFERGAAELDVVQDDDRADLTHAREQFVPLGAVQGGAVHGVEEVVQQIGGRAVEAGEADDAVGGEVHAVLGDEVEQAGAARATGADQTYGAAAGQHPYQLFALVLAGQERFGGTGRTGWDRRLCGAVRLGAFGRGQLLGPPGTLRRRADLDLAAVDGVDGEQVVTGDQLHRAGECGRVLAEVGREGVPGRARTRRLAVGVMAVLLGSPGVRVHRFQAPQKRRVQFAAPPGLCTPRCRFWSGPARRGLSRQRAAEP